MSVPQQTTWKRAGLALGLLVLLLALTLAPLGLLVRSGLPEAGAAAALQRLLDDALLLQAVLRTLAVALLACGLASALAIPLAFAAVRATATVRALIHGLALLPLMMPPFLTAAVVRDLLATLDRIGAPQAPAALAPSGSSLTLVLAFALHFFPLVLYSVARGLADCDRGLQETARNLGAGPVEVWHRITLALATPAYVFGAALMVLRILEDVGSALVLEVDGLLAPLVLAGLATAGAPDTAQLGAVLALLLLSLLTVGLAWTELSRGSNLSTAAPGARPLRWSGAGARLWQALLVGGLAVLALSPHLWLVLMALGEPGSEGTLPAAFDPGALATALGGGLPALHSTLELAALAGALTLLLGLAAGRLPGIAGWPGGLTRSAVTLLFGVPGVVLALAYRDTAQMLAPGAADWPLLGGLALALVVSLKQLPFAQRLLAAPAPAHYHATLATARNLGAQGPGLAARMGLPLLAGPLLGLFALGAMAAMLELSAALVLLGGEDAPLAVDVFRALRDPAGAAAGATRGLLLVLMPGAALLLLYRILRRRRRRRPCVLGAGAVPEPGS